MSDKTITLLGLEHASMMTDLFSAEDRELTTMIPLSSLREFKGHPFKVVDNDQMKELIGSIRANGVLTPVTVRESGIGTYEMISGHRRWHACRSLGLKEIPAIIKNMSDEEAVIAMVDANIQREEISPSEKAFAYKMKLEAMKRQSRRGGNSGRSDKRVGEVVGESARTVQRFIRLTELIPELLQAVDDKKLQFMTGVEASYLPKDVQKWVYAYFMDAGDIKKEKLLELKKYPSKDDLNEGKVREILSGVKVKKKSPPKRTFTLSEKQLDQYFGPDVTADEIRDVILSFLESRLVQ